MKKDEKETEKRIANIRIELQRLIDTKRSYERSEHATDNRDTKEFCFTLEERQI